MFALAIEPEHHIDDSEEEGTRKKLLQRIREATNYSELSEVHKSDIDIALNNILTTLLAINSDEDKVFEAVFEILDNLPEMRDMQRRLNESNKRLNDDESALQ